MTVTVTLELKFKPDEVAAGRELMGRVLQDTRAFDGNVQTDVLVDEDDEAHWLIYELWETVEADEAYRSVSRRRGQDHAAASAAGRTSGQDPLHHQRRLAQRRNHFALKQFHPGTVVGGLGEVADHVLAAKVAQPLQPLDDLLRVCPWPNPVRWFRRASRRPPTRGT